MSANNALSVLLCNPKYFDVFYEINAWMHTDNPVNLPLAKLQWDRLVGTYRQLGYSVDLIEPVEGLPDMVFTANGALVLGGRVALPRFRYEQRQPETERFTAWFSERFGAENVMLPDASFEGEGDAMFAGDVLLAGYGFRSDRESHAELASFFDKEVVSLQLVDDRFYHLDTCLSILDDKSVAYFPPAFSQASVERIEELFERTILATEEDAVGFGLNMVSSGSDVFVSAQAPHLQYQLSDLGFSVHEIDVSEFKKSGGGIKCMTLFLEQPHVTPRNISSTLVKMEEAEV